ncbi:hypothetical protein SUGI_0670320 [Cryptomeria japonica]|nr:hypothetical protein SUGI_0670320 [Cryptomeria japonica]
MMPWNWIQLFREGNNQREPLKARLAVILNLSIGNEVMEIRSNECSVGTKSWSLNPKHENTWATESCVQIIDGHYRLSNSARPLQLFGPSDGFIAPRIAIRWVIRLTGAFFPPPDGTLHLPSHLLCFIIANSGDFP